MLSCTATGYVFNQPENIKSRKILIDRPLMCDSPFFYKSARPRRVGQAVLSCKDTSSGSPRRLVGRCGAGGEVTTVVSPGCSCCRLDLPHQRKPHLHDLRRSLPAATIIRRCIDHALQRSISFLQKDAGCSLTNPSWHRTPGRPSTDMNFNPAISILWTLICRKCVLPTFTGHKNPENDIVANTSSQYRDLCKSYTSSAYRSFVASDAI